MSMKDWVNQAKPYVIGGVVGAIAVTILGFQANLVVTTSTMEETVQRQTVQAYADVCQQTALAAWQDQGGEVSALGGWRNEARAELVQQHVPVAEDFPLRQNVVDQCNRLMQRTVRSL